MAEIGQGIRIAVAGTGFFSQFHYDAWSRLGVEIAGLCSLDERTTGVAAETYGVSRTFSDLEVMLDTVQPDLLDIVTPPPTHLGFVKAAAKRGIPVICQKPFAADLAGAEAALAIAEEFGNPVIVHENFRFQPWYREIKRLLEDGALGTPYQVSFRLRPGDGQGPDAYMDRQPYFQDMPRFLVHETAIHLIDVFRYLFGDIAAVTAHLTRLNPAISGEDAGIILFEFSGGGRGLFDGNRLSDHAAVNRRLVMGEMWVEGSAATLHLDGDARLFVRRHGENDETAVDYAWEDRGYGGDCVYTLQEHVLKFLQGDGAVMNSAGEYLRNIRIEEAVYRSAKEARRIELEHTQP